MKTVIVVERLKNYLPQAQLFNPNDCEVVRAGSNENALVLHRQLNAHLIVASFSGAGMDGRALCSQIRSDRVFRRVSVIVCCRGDEFEKADECRANAIVILPGTGSVLRDKICEFLNISARGNYRAHFRARYTGHSLRGEFPCCLENISRSGMLMEANADLDAGDWISCMLVLPNSIAFEVQAEVIRTVKSKTGRDPNWYGVRFTRIDRAAEQAIEVLVQKRLNTLHRGIS